MIVRTYDISRFYLRRDPDAGWCLALWRFRVFFQVVTGAKR